ncbi:MAG: VWA domain-containing protein, partial [Armatimonadetes bacterium]|nr:VWA domain-containing protein [Armatimonadota bacterium]
MNPIVQWLLGLRGDAADTLAQAKLALAGIPVSVAAVVLGAMACWAAVHYWFDGKRPSWWVKGPLLCIRILAVASLLVILLEPVLTWTRTSRRQSTFLVLTDTSESMARRDPRLPGRLADPMTTATGLDARAASRGRLAAAKLPPRKGGPMAELARRFDVRAYSFDDETRPVDLRKAAKSGSGPLEPRTTGDGTTQIGAALRTVLDDNSGRPVAGILLVSDGGSNQGDDPVAWARRARSLGIPITTIGLGDPTPTRDLAVLETLADRVVRKDNEVRVFVGLRHRGHGGSSVTVSLSRNGAPLASKSVTLARDATKQTVPFVFTPRATGEFRFTASVSRLSGET